MEDVKRVASQYGFEIEVIYTNITIDIFLKRVKNLMLSPHSVLVLTFAERKNN